MSYSSYFRIPGLKMTVIQKDGQNVVPVVVDQIPLAVAETYDVIVMPDNEQAYTLFAQSADRTGYAPGWASAREPIYRVVKCLNEKPNVSQVQLLRRSEWRLLV
ncbi:hypothetical protein [Endozoicomonas sp.]|uniref:hypothetical protein n=1 Tax=Endozoicomonas sp. TaxID=1892382 RepID=UPI00383B0D6D